MTTEFVAALPAEAVRLSPWGLQAVGQSLELGTSVQLRLRKGNQLAADNAGGAAPGPDPVGSPPTALISWSHEDLGWTPEQRETRKDEVLRLANVLRANGIDADVDLYHLTEAVSWTHWGPRMVTDSDYVLVIASEGWSNAWERRGDPTKGAGAAAEADALQTLLASDRDAFLRKVRLIVLPDTDSALVPTGLSGIPRYPLHEITDLGVRDLLRDLTGQAKHPKPPLGPLPELPPSVVGRMDAVPLPAALDAATIDLRSPHGEAPAKQHAATTAELLHGTLPPDGGTIAWRATWDQTNSTETVVAVHVVPVPARPFPARALAAVASTLPMRVRQANVLDPTIAVEIRDDPDGVTLHFPPGARYLQGTRDGSLGGVRVNRSGQVSAWHTLPADNMGSITNRENLTDTIAACLRLIGLAGVPDTDFIAVGTELGPMIMVTHGPMSDLGQRTRAQLNTFGPAQLQVPPDETVEAAALADRADEAATDLAQVLMRHWLRR